MKLVVFLILGLAPFSSWACATCGLSDSFTPLMFFISLGFVVLPLSFVGFIGFRLWKEKQGKRELN